MLMHDSQWYHWNLDQMWKIFIFPGLKVLNLDTSYLFYWSRNALFRKSLLYVEKLKLKKSVFKIKHWFLIHTIDQKSFYKNWESSSLHGGSVEIKLTNTPFVDLEFYGPNKPNTHIHSKIKSCHFFYQGLFSFNKTNNEAKHLDRINLEVNLK